MSQKKKKWFKSAFLEDPSPTVTTSSKKARTASFIDLTLPDDLFENSLPTMLSPSQQQQSNLPKVPINPTSSNWIEHFAPQVAADLATHPKKITEVHDWLRHYESTKKKCAGQMLLITGPAGSGKTATLKVLAAEMRFELVEWIVPIDIELARSGNTTSFDGQDATYKEAQIDIFKQFLFKSSRYRSVFEAMQKRLVLVEDFPNAFIRDSNGFEELLQDYRMYGKCPLVFIITDSKSRQLNLAYNLFPENVKTQQQIVHISFNPVSTTLMKKALSRICSFMSQDGLNKFYKVPAPSVIESVNLASQGDIRNAVINLHFASQKGAPNLQTEQSSKSETNKSKSKGRRLKTIGRDESITLMHALGRVFNPKYEENIKPKKFLHNPEDITDAFSSEPKMFVDFLHTNYLGHMSTIESALEAANCISSCDVLIGDYREDSLAHIGLNIAIRGLMVSNTKPVSGWIPVKGFKRNQVESNLEEELLGLGVKFELSRNVMAADYRTYARIIKSSSKHNFK